MANLTINVDDDTLRQARICALQQNTSVNAVLNRFLTEYARMDEIRQKRSIALSAVLALAQTNTIERDDSPWRRDELYER